MYKGGYKFIGHVPQRNLCNYYHQASVFVMPSIEEGLSVVQLQAMSCGIPIICTTNSGGEDIIEEGESGFTIPIRNTESLKNKIMYFYNNRSECLRMGKNARTRIEGGYTWDHYGDKIISIYRDKLREWRNKG